MIDKIKHFEADLAPKVTNFLADIVSIKSLSSQEDAVIARIKQEMEAVGFDSVREDGFGNLIGVIEGDGPTIAFDAHIDVVDAGDTEAWQTPPFEAVIRDGWLYGRGSSDQKAGMASIVYGGWLLKQLGVKLPFRYVATAAVQEEDCDGLCWRYMVEKDGFRPDAVVITEPTNNQVYRGHRGRMEVMIRVRGLSAHGAMPQQGKNAIYMMSDIVQEVRDLSNHLKHHDFLGSGTLTISGFKSGAPSQCSVADYAEIYIDRRMTLGETRDTVVQELQNLPSVKKYGAEVIVPVYERPTRTGLVYPVDKYFPTWLTTEDAPVLKAALEAGESVLGRPQTAGRWKFSTNGVSTMGVYGIPTIGFGPGNEDFAHSPNERCDIAQLPVASMFYALFGFDFAKHFQG